MMVQSTFQHTSALCVRYEPGMGLPGATGWLLPYCVLDYSIFLLPFIFLVVLFPCLSLWGMPLPAEKMKETVYSGNSFTPSIDF